MTNLVAIGISIVATNTSELRTNVVESAHDPAKLRVIQMYYDNRIQPPQTEKWVTTTVEKIEKLQFDWKGKARETIESTLISSNTVHLRIKQEWEAVK